MDIDLGYSALGRLNFWSMEKKNEEMGLFSLWLRAHRGSGSGGVSPV